MGYESETAGFKKPDQPKPTWQNSSGRNEPHKRFVDKEAIRAAVAAKKKELDGLRATGATRLEKSRCEKEIDHLWKQFERAETHHRRHQ